MEEEVEIIIPTMSRDKISRRLSYPIGAREVSTGLSTVSQFGSLKLYFYSRSDFQLRRGRYEFLRVEYLKSATPAQEWPISWIFSRPPQYRWEIVVQPVPRVIRHPIKEYILADALPRVASWLKERTSQANRGSDILAFFYDEKLAQFEARTVTRLEPLRT